MLFVPMGFIFIFLLQYLEWPLGKIDAPSYLPVRHRINCRPGASLVVAPLDAPSRFSRRVFSAGAAQLPVAAGVEGGAPRRVVRSSEPLCFG